MKSAYPVQDRVQEILKRIPENPGVYQYYDETGTIIYVGKAKNLKKRVLSYFSKDHADSPKIRKLVQKIKDLKIIEVETKENAWLLKTTLLSSTVRDTMSCLRMIR